MVFSCCTTWIQGGRDTSHNTISAAKTLLHDVRFKFQIYDKGYNSGGCAFVKTDTQERAWVPGLHVLLFHVFPVLSFFFPDQMYVPLFFCHILPRSCTTCCTIVGVTSAATSHGKRWKGRASSHFLGQLLTKIEMAEMRLQLLRGLPKPNPNPERIAADGDYLKRYLALFYCQFFICFFHMFFLVFQFFVFSNFSFGFSTCFSLFSSFSFFPTFHLVFPHVFHCFPFFRFFQLLIRFLPHVFTCFPVFRFFQLFIWFFHMFFLVFSVFH